MTIPTENPQGVMRVAASRLRKHTDDLLADIQTNPYWGGRKPDETWRTGIDNAAGGAAGTYAALWTPTVADAVHVLLTAAAETYETAVDCDECPDCDVCPGHSTECVHEDCGRPVDDCECLGGSVLRLARAVLGSEQR